MSPADQEKYNTRIKALEEAYAPQVQGLQQQIATLPQQFEAQKSALQQAKENAFRDITKTASRGGMFFTGFTPREEARYLGEKYLPGLQMLGQQETSARQGLLGQIAGLQGQIKTGALSYMDQLEALRRAEEEAARNRAAAASAAAFDADALRRLLEPDEEPTPTEELDPYYDYARTAIENAKPLGRLADNRIKTLINVQKQFVLGIGAKRNATEQAKQIARGRLNAFKAVLGEAKYKSLGGI